MNPANILRDRIQPALAKAEIEWKGWHGFRRALATNLVALGIPDIVASQILRHSSVEITRRCYVKRVSDVVTDAMGKFEQAVAAESLAHGVGRA